MRTITEEQFDKEFTLLNDHPINTVAEIETELGPTDASHIWTYIDGDEGGTYLISGVHWVNAFAFGVTKEAHTTDIQVELDSPEDETERWEEEQRTGSYDIRITGLDAIYGTDSYVDAFLALGSDIYDANKTAIEQIQREHPEFDIRIDLVPHQALCRQEFMAGQTCVLPQGHEGGHR